MSEHSKIEWTDSTFNPWIGCTKISPGCDHCYAERDMDIRRHRVKWGAGNPRSRTNATYWKQPIRWNAEAYKFGQCEACGHRGNRKQDGICDLCGGRANEARRRVFCASLADVFDNEVDPSWRRDLFELIDATPSIDWLLLTKRIGNVAEMLPEDWGHGYPNVWLGATIVNQAEADRDIPKLLRVPSMVKFLSCEPLLGDLDIRRWIPWARCYFLTQCEHCGWMGTSELALESRTQDDVDVFCPSCKKSFCCDEIDGLDWIIAGGESGPHARPAHPNWLRSLRDQCWETPFLFKQWGEWAPFHFDGSRRDWMILSEDGLIDIPDDRMPDDQSGEVAIARVGKTAAGRLLDGDEYTEFPEIR